MTVVRILFLGASKRVSLMERFFEAARRLQVRLELFSCETDAQFRPISNLSTVLAGPSFLSGEFEPWLQACVERHAIDIVIPNMDSATVALSRYAEAQSGRCWYLVSTRRLCERMADKLMADAFFRERGIPVPPNMPGRFPKILKPRFGCGAKGIRIVTDAPQLDEALSQRPAHYLVQDYIPDFQETTVDFFRSSTYGLLGYVLRDRIEVENGEVMVCRTRAPRNEERRLIEQIAAIPGWQGCITLQYLTDPNGDLHVVEINPRFGGGATCSIEAGLDMAYYILSEHLGMLISPVTAIRNVIMSRARRDFFHEYQSSLC